MPFKIVNNGWRNASGQKKFAHNSAVRSNARCERFGSVGYAANTWIRQSVLWLPLKSSQAEARSDVTINPTTNSPVNSQIMRISHASRSMWIANGKRKVNVA